MKLIAQFILFLSLFTCFYSQASQNLDVDGNGKADILWRNQVTGQNWLWTMNGVVVDESKSLNTIGLHWDIVGRGDFDGDGKSDIFWRNNESGRNYIYLMDGFTIRGSTELNYLPYFDWKVRGVTDVNGDGMDDVIWRHQTTGRTWLYTIDGVSIIDSKGLNTVADLNWQIVGTGDINGDGKGDVIWRHKTSGANFIWLMNGTTILDSYVLNTVPTSWHIVGVGDLDGDDTDDIIWRSESGLNWAYLMNDGQIGTSKQINTIANQDWQIRTVGDLNGDGKADIFWRNQSTGKTYAYLMDGTSILTAGYSSVISLKWQIISESTLPTSESVVTPEPEPEPEPEVDEVQEYYSENVSAQIVQSKCILCHTANGAAGSTGLIFEKSTTANYQQINQQRIVDFLATEGVDSTYLLTKAQGGLAHGGGSQIVFGSDEFETLSTYLELVSGGGGGSSTTNFWEGVGLLDNKQTLRRAAIIIAGRLPTETEYAAVSDNKEASLKVAVKGLMQGDSFHRFLIEGANDRLLVERDIHSNGNNANFINPGFQYMPELTNYFYDLFKNGITDTHPHYMRFVNGYANAPLELIAYVIENDKPYSEILTADYTMVNPATNLIYRAEAEFVDSSDHQEYHPGKIEWHDPHSTIFTEDEFGVLILQEGDIVDWPHAGVLSDPAFMQRYPSTSTNRNRARARWTFYHYLGFDIEKSAGRSLDPEVLADTNNPTMNNPACTACHENMDPVAGAFKFFNDDAQYKSNSTDSLAHTYIDESPLYQHGDTWYRDMRTPGFNNEIAPEEGSSIQWLAQQMVEDSRFYPAAITFWWQSLMGSGVAAAPENSSDYNYQNELLLFQQQTLFIETVSEQFKVHKNMKDVFTDIIISPWFRATSVDSSNAQASEYLMNIGSEKLLTPEQLERKTQSITGYSWNERFEDYPYPNKRMTNLLDEMRLIYGGIDSNGSIKRTLEMNSLMSLVARTHAMEASCPIVISEFNRSTDDKILFKGLTRNLTPLSITSNSITIDAYTEQNAKNYTVNNVELTAGNRQLSISYTNDKWVEGTDMSLMIDSLVIRNIDNDQKILDMKGSELGQYLSSNDCGGPFEDNLEMWSNCTSNIPFVINQSGNYEVVVGAFYVVDNESGPLGNVEGTEFGPALVDINLELTDYNDEGKGSLLIKEKIVELHQKLLGEWLDVDDEEVQRSFNLFVQAMKNHQARGASHIDNGNSACNFDFEGDTWSEWGSDPRGVLTAWRVIVAYLMSDQKYIHE